MKCFVVTGGFLDEKTGEISSCLIAANSSREAAVELMREMYLANLEVMALEDNGASNSLGEAVPGGYFYEDEACIYNFAEFAFGQLLCIAKFNMQEVCI